MANWRWISGCMAVGSWLGSTTSVIGTKTKLRRVPKRFLLQLPDPIHQDVALSA